jgi:hypothetical protein
LDHGVLLVGYGQSGGGDVINEWVHGNPWKSWKPCAPENWMVSTPFPPFPIKDPISKPWWHGGFTPLGMAESAKCGRSSLLDHQELLGPSMGRRRCLATKEAAVAVSSNMDNTNKQRAEWDPEQWVFFVSPQFSNIFHTTCGILWPWLRNLETTNLNIQRAECEAWPVGCQRMSWVGDRRRCDFNSGFTMDSISTVWRLWYHDIYDKHPRGAGISFSIQILHGMTSDFHP